MVALYGFIEADGTFFNLDRDAAEHVRATFVLVAVWYLVFALPAFIFVPDRPSTGLGMIPLGGNKTFGDYL